MENPWKTIWVHPRETVQAIVAENPKKHLWILSFIYGFTALLNGFQSFPLALKFGLLPLLLLTVIFAALFGYVFISAWSWVIVKVGRIFGGKATFESARAAYAWSCVPLIGNIPLWILIMLFYSDLFFYGVERILMPGPAAFLFIILMGKLVFAIWSIVLYLQTLAEVQNFSILRAIGNVILSSIALAIAVAFLCVIIALMAHSITKPLASLWILQPDWIVESIQNP